MDSNVFKQHGEKISLAVSALILAVYVVMGWVLWTPPPTAQQTEELISKVNTNLASGKKPELPSLPTEEQVRAQWKIDDTMGNAQKGLEWVAYWRPKATPHQVEGPPKDIIALYPPKMDEPTVDIGRVNLSWDADSKTNAEIKGWRLERKSGDGKWSVLVDLNGSDKSYTDEKTEPKKTYSYRVKCVPDEVAKITENKGDTSKEVSATTPDTTSIRVVGGTVQMAQIEVQKYINGKWEVDKDNVKPNEKIGKKRTRMVDRKMTTFDFETGYELLTIKQETKETKVKKTRNVWKDDPNEPGKKIQFPEEYEEVIKDTKLHITYKDDTGAEKDLWQEPPREKEAPKKKEPPKKEGEGK